MPQTRNEPLRPWALAGLMLGAIAAGAVVQSLVRRPFSFRNRSVLITGGSRGLGLEIARVFAEQGARIALAGRNASTLEAARKELATRGAHVLTIPCDVRNREEVQSAVETVVRNFGRLDVLINNAGVIQVG